MPVEETSPSPSPSPPPSPSLSPSLSRSRSRSPSPSPSPSRCQSSAVWPPRSPSPSTSCSLSSSSSSSSKSSPRSPLPPSESRSDEGGAGGAKKLLFMFVTFSGGPIAYCLYAVDAPDPVPCSKAAESCDNHQVVTEPNILYPILEFPTAEFPKGMNCVELNSKLYFLGGRLRHDGTKKRKDPCGDLLAVVQPNVYVLDARAIASSNRSPSELFEEGTKMNSGKPHPYVFVAYGRIFVIEGHDEEGISRFEVFDPNTKRWSIMPNPPLNVPLTGHAVFESKVFMVGMDNSICYFDVDTHQWVTFSKYGSVYPSFYSRAEFVEDTLYACSRETIAAFGPISSVGIGLMDRVAFLTHEMNDVLNRIPTPDHSPYLVPFGNRTFCYVFAGTLPDPNYPNKFFFRDSEKFQISLTVLEALKDTYTEFVDGFEKIFFRAKFLRSAHFVASSRCGVEADSAFLKGCFYVPS